MKDRLDSAMSAVSDACYKASLVKESLTVPHINKNVINVQMVISFKITFARTVQPAVLKLDHLTVSAPSAKMAISIQGIVASKINTKLIDAISLPATKTVCTVKPDIIRLMVSAPLLINFKEEITWVLMIVSDPPPGPLAQTILDSQPVEGLIQQLHKEDHFLQLLQPVSHPLPPVEDQPKEDSKVEALENLLQIAKFQTQQEDA